MATNADDYGYRHRKARAEALDAFIDGAPCPICHHAMRAWQALDLHHLIPRALGGHGTSARALAHASCNRAQGHDTALLVARRRGRAVIRRKVTHRNRSGRRAW
jgi:5-methylcytosine-specific restriction endonuclease McrA